MTRTRLTSTLQVLCRACAQDCGRSTLPSNGSRVMPKWRCRLSLHCHLVDRHSAVGTNNISVITWTNGCGGAGGILFALGCFSQWDFAPALVLLNRQLYRSPQSSHMTLWPLCVGNKRIPVGPVTNIKSWSCTVMVIMCGHLWNTSLCAAAIFASAQLLLCNGTLSFYFRL